MSPTSSNKPVIFLAFAQDRVEGRAYLRNLPIELDSILEALQKAEQAGLCKVEHRSNTTIKNILDTFQQYQDRIAVFHYGGHADSYELLLESQTGERAIAHSEGLVSFLAKQKGLQLVFLNGCCSQQQARDLIESGVSAVVGTSRTIDDEIATSLSGRFYKGLAAGLAIDRAWAEAVDQIKVEKGTSNTRALHWKGKVEASDRFPWEIYYRQGAEIVKQWNLPAAANQPLFGLRLPEAYYRKLPRAPFIWLQDFKHEEAAIFFGRGAEIRKLYTQITTGAQPIILFYGKAGVGKSSLLQAGLAPRIEDKYTVKYSRRIQTKGLTGTLTQALQEAGDECGLPPVAPTATADLHAKIEELQKALEGSTGFARQVLEGELQKLTVLAGETITFATHWRRVEKETGRPLIIILDQVEENFTRHELHGGDSAGELENFLETVRNLFEQKEMPPRGKLILSCREEYHRPIRAALQAFALPCAETFLPPLGWGGIIEAVEGVTQHPATQDQYHLEIERSSGSNLPEIIADDLLEDKESPVAPMLQILLTELWKAAVKENAKTPRFTVRQYQELKQTGAMMHEFFQQQMRRVQDWQNNVVDSGLTLDLLYRHTSPAGVTESLRREHAQEIYRDRQEVMNRLIAICEDLYLLTEAQSGTSLAHNLLAPVVIKEYSISVKPGQQAARILNSKIDEFRAHKKDIWLNDADLEIVETGKAGMRQLNADEEKLLQVSRIKKEERERKQKRNRRIRNVLVVVIFAFAILAGWKWWESDRNYKQSQASQLAFRAKEVFKSDNTKALRIANAAYGILETRSPAIVTQTLSEIFHSQDLRPFYAANFPHNEHVNSAVFSPDGRQILTTSEDGFAKLWDQHGKSIHAFNHHGYEVKAAVFSPNGKQILTLANDIVRLWEMNGKLVASDTLESGQAADLSDFSTDGIRILKVFAGSEDEEYRALIQRLKQEEGIFEVIPVSNQQRILTISSYGIVRLRDGRGEILKNLDSSAVSAAFSSDGKRMLTVTVDTLSTIRFWDEQGDFLGEFKLKGEVNKAVFSPEGRQILTAANDHTAKLWDFSQKFVHRLPQHGMAVNAVAFSPDGTRLVTALFNGFVRFWEVQGNLLDSLKHDGVVNSAVFSPEGKRILTASRDGTARLWKLDEARVVILSHRGEVRTAIFSPDAGSRILTASRDSTARVWTANGDPVKTLRHHGEVLSAVFSREGRQILTVATDSTATLWAANGDLIKTFKHGDEVNAAAFSPEGKQILTACADGTARLWAVNGDSLRAFKHNGKVKIAAFAPDGSRILTAYNIVKLWDERGNLLDSLAHQSVVNSAVFSAAGRQLLTASVDNSAKLWNLKGELLANYGKHTLPVNSAVFSPDGKKIITASIDGDAIIWQAPQAIYEWLKTAPVYRLTREEEELYEIVK